MTWVQSSFIFGQTAEEINKLYTKYQFIKNHKKVRRYKHMTWVQCLFTIDQNAVKINKLYTNALKKHKMTRMDQM